MLVVTLIPFLSYSLIVEAPASCCQHSTSSETRAASKVFPPIPSDRRLYRKMEQRCGNSSKSDTRSDPSNWTRSLFYTILQHRIQELFRSTMVPSSIGMQNCKILISSSLGCSLSSLMRHCCIIVVCRGFQTVLPQTGFGILFSLRLRLRRPMLSIFLCLT